MPRAIIAVLIASIMLAGVVRAQQTAPIDTGTYLVEVASGRMVRLGENALVAWSPDGKVAAVADLSLIHI